MIFLIRDTFLKKILIINIILFLISSFFLIPFNSIYNVFIILLFLFGIFSSVFSISSAIVFFYSIFILFKNKKDLTENQKLNKKKDGLKGIIFSIVFYIILLILLYLRIVNFINSNNISWI